MTLLKGIYYFFLAVFLLKALWNFALAYVLVSEMIKERLEESRGVSIMPGIDLIALVALLGLSALIESDSLLFDQQAVLLSGVALIAVSLVHFFLVAAIGSLVASKFFPRSNDTTED